MASAAKIFTSVSAFWRLPADFAKGTRLARFSDRARLSRERAGWPACSIAEKSQDSFAYLQGWPRSCARRARDPIESATIRVAVVGDARSSIAQDPLRDSVEKSQDRSRHLSRSQPWFGGGGSGISKPREPPPF